MKFIDSQPLVSTDSLFTGHVSIKYNENSYGEND